MINSTLQVRKLSSNGLNNLPNMVNQWWSQNSKWAHVLNLHSASIRSNKLPNFADGEIEAYINEHAPKNKTAAQKGSRLYVWSPGTWSRVPPWTPCPLSVSTPISHTAVWHCIGCSTFIIHTEYKTSFSKQKINFLFLWWTGLRYVLTRAG